MTNPELSPPRLFLTTWGFNKWATAKNPHKPKTVAHKKWLDAAETDQTHRMNRVAAYFAGVTTGAIIATTTLAALGGITT